MTNVRNPSVLIWAAVSSKVQAQDDKYSIPEQILLGQQTAERMQASIVDTLVVPGFSRDYYTLEEVAAAAQDQEVEAFRKLQWHIKHKTFTHFVFVDADRFGRKPSLVHEVIGRITDDARATLVSILDGEIRDENVELYAMFKATQARQELRKLVTRRKTGMRSRAARGLKVGSRVPFAYREVRDLVTAKAVAMVPDEQFRPLLDDLAALVLEGIAIRQMEQVMYERFGYAHRRGGAYPPFTFRGLLYSPVTWGHNAMNHRNAKGANGLSIGAWAFDESEALPPGVVMYRNTHEPLYTGKLADRLKAELRRRLAQAGRTTPQHTHMFSGLMVCAECSYNMVIAAGRPNYWTGYRCNTRYHPGHVRGVCHQTRYVSNDYIQSYFDAVLRRMFANNDLDIFEPQAGRDLERRAASIVKEVAATRQQMARLGEAIKTVDISNPAWQYYADEMRQAGDRITQLEQTLTQTERDIARLNTVQQQAVRDDIKALTLDMFWTLPSREVNQYLTRLVGPYRLAIENGEVKHVVLAPPRRRK